MKNGLIKAWREYRGFALFIVLMIIFRSALADWNVVPTGSMKPTILEGDRILVNKLAYDFKVPLTHISVYKFADPKRGDIVVFDSKPADTRLVKRVIGLPGDTSTINHWDVGSVDGAALLTVSNSVLNSNQGYIDGGFRGQDLLGKDQDGNRGHPRDAHDV